MATNQREIWDWLQILGPYFIGSVALFVGLKDIIFNFFNRPRIKPQFKPNKEEYCHKILFNPLEEIDDPITGIKYIIRQPGFNSRVAIWNRGKSTAKNVQVRLVDIDVYNKQIKFVKRKVYHPSLVRWSGERTYASIDIPQSSKFYLDLFYSINESNREVYRYHSELGKNILKRVVGSTEYSNDIYWNVWIDATYPRGVSQKEIVEGRFKMHFVIYGDNFKPKNFEVQIDWAIDTWNTPNIILVKS